MKFTDGYWKVREDLSLYQAAEAVETETTEHSITVYASGRQSGGRKDLGGVTLTIQFFSPMEDCIGVRISHYLGRKEKQPRFYENKDCGTVSLTENEAVITLGRAKAVVSLGEDWNVEFYYGDRKLTKSGWRSAGYAAADSGKCYIKEELQLAVNEHVYGLGERFTPFIKNGQSVEIWNRDGGTSSDQAYKNIPFYITDRGYGVLVNHMGKVSYEVASEKVERVQFCVEGESLEYCVIGGSSMEEVVGSYNRLTGMPALPPAWSFGLWLTTSFTTDYDEKTVMHFIDGMAERNIPLQVFHFDCFWMKGGHWCDFRWDPDAFPDPEGMLGRLKEKGLKVCVWINPYIAQRSLLFEEGMEKGYFLLRTDGSVWQTDEWQPGMAIVDFTNPEAKAWYQDKLRELLHMGVDTFKTDFGERIPSEDVVYANGCDPEQMHNYYSYLYNEAVFELLEQEKGKGQALVFARSATCGGQKFPVHWGGDCVASYESMAESLRGGLSLAMCGFGFWSHDMGGFENCATPDLYKRWVAFGMLSTHSRLHGNSSYRVPWLFDEEAVDVLRHFTRLKCSLMPYLYGGAVKVRESGIPLMRPMILEFPQDASAPYLDMQYMLGDSLLVAPVFSEQGEALYYLPEGKWTNHLTGEVKAAGWHKQTFDYFTLPVMVRENSIIPVGQSEETVYNYEEDLLLKVYELSGSAHADIYSKDGEAVGTAVAEREKNKFRLRSAGLKNPEFLLVNSGEPAEISNGTGRMTKEGYRVKPEDCGRECIVIYKEGGTENGIN